MHISPAGVCGKSAPFWEMPAITFALPALAALSLCYGVVWMLMPEPDQQVIDRRDQICRTLRSIVPADCVIDSTESMRAFDADGLSAYRQLPLAVVLPPATAPAAPELQLPPVTAASQPSF